VNGFSRRLSLLARRYVVAAGGTAYLFTLGLRRGRHRGFIAQIARHFGYAGELRGIVPTIAYDRATYPETPVVLPAVIGKSGNVSDAELVAISRIVAAKKPRSLLEIGTFDGRTTIALAANAPADAIVTTLDLPADTAHELPVEGRDRALIDKPVSGALVAGSPWAARVRQVYGDSATYDFGGLQIDFAFIDGSHSYEYALSDSRRVRAMMRGGRGVIMWHDYGGEWEGVTRALNELSREPGFAGLKWIEGTTLAILDLQ
jgi:hypothetical protein